MFSQSSVSRAALAIIMVLPVFLIWGGAELYLNSHAQREQHEKIQNGLNNIRSRLEQNLYSNLLILNSLAAIVKTNPDIDQAQFSRLARHFKLTDGIVRNIGLAPDMVIRSIYPLAGNKAALGLNYRQHPEQWKAVEKAIQTRKIQIAGPLTLVQGGRGVIARLAVFIDAGKSGEKLWGIISSVMDVDKLFELSGITPASLPFKLAMRGLDGNGEQGAVFFGERALFDHSGNTVRVDLPGGSWLLAGAPRADAHQSVYTNWLYSIRLISLLALLFAFVIWRSKSRNDREKRASRRALRESERRFKDLVENTHDWIWEVDANGVYTYVSPRVEDLLGYTADQVLGKTPFDFMPPAEAARVGEIFRVFVEHKQAFDALENTNLHRNGEAVVLETSGTPIISEQGELLGYRGTDRDITGRKVMERKLKKEQIFNHQLVQAAGSIIVVMDRSGCIVRFNRAAEKITGYTFAELENRPIWETLIPYDVREQVKAVFEHLKAGDIVAHYQNEWRMKDGSHRLFDWFNTILSEEDGRVSHILSHGYDITEQKRLEQELIQNNQRFYNMFELSPDPVWIIHDGQFVDCNLAAVEKMGFGDKQGLLNRHPSELSPEFQPDGEASKDKAQKMIEQAMKEGLHRFEWVHQRADGSTFYAEVTLSLILLGQKEVLYCSFQDISERKRSEQALIESELRFRTMFDNASVGILLADIENMQLIDANERICSMLEYSKQALLQLRIEQLHPQHELQKVRELFQGDSRKKVQTVNELQMLNKSGQAISMAVNASVLTLQGRPVLIGYFIDISLQKQHEKELAQYHNQLEALVTNRTRELENAEAIAHVGSWNINFQQDQLNWSSETYRIFGMTDKSPVSMDVLIERVYPQDRQKLLQAWSRALQGERYDFTHRIIVDGRIRWVQERAKIKFDHQGQPVYANGTVQDITHQIETNEALQRAREQAESSARARSEFIANMSHEIRTPLNAVLGLSRMGGHCASADEAQKLFRRIDESGQYLLSLINDILDFSRIEADRLQLEQRAFDLHRSIDRVIGIMRPQARSKGLQLTLKRPEELQQWVQGDALRCEQILINLLSNAIKFTEQGEVELSVRDTPAGIRFDVRDSGIGIADDVLPTLFSAFTQADSSTTREYGGTGLGLSISYNLAQLMGGSLKAISTPGKGSTFTLVLPLPATRAGQAREGDDENRCAALKGLHILSAEDNEVNRMVLEDLLVQHGATVEFAENGQIAVDKVLQQNGDVYDLVLMDIQMPVMDGHQAARKILSIEPEMPIIGLTAHAFVEERLRCHESGMIAHVSKPIDEAQLCESIALALKLPQRDSTATSTTVEKEESALESQSADALIDWSALAQRYPNRQSFIDKLLKTVSLNEVDTAANIRLALEQKNYPELRERAHALKGMAGNIFAHSLMQQAKQVEQLSKQEDAAALTEARKLAQMLENVLQQLAARQKPASV